MHRMYDFHPYTTESNHDFQGNKDQYPLISMLLNPLIRLPLIKQRVKTAIPLTGRLMTWLYIIYL